MTVMMMIILMLIIIKVMMMMMIENAVNVMMVIMVIIMFMILVVTMIATMIITIISIPSISHPVPNYIQSSLSVCHIFLNYFSSYLLLRSHPEEKRNGLRIKHHFSKAEIL